MSLKSVQNRWRHCLVVSFFVLSFLYFYVTRHSLGSGDVIRVETPLNHRPVSTSSPSTYVAPSTVAEPPPQKIENESKTAVVDPAAKESSVTKPPPKAFSVASSVKEAPAKETPAKETSVKEPPAKDASIKESAREPSRTLVIAKTSEENTDWIGQGLNQLTSFKAAVYVVNDGNATYRVPKNKGHEAMVYLTYVIDHYDDLADVTMFMHAHMLAWHNNDILDSNAAEMVKALRPERVLREGYMNMRCHWDPGCPAHIRPTETEEDINIPEAAIMGRVWKQLFPGEKVPDVLSQPCCAQMAVSRDRIRLLPRQRYISLRDWIINSDLEDRLSGRVFEYVWQYLWTGEYEFCPLQSVCYCDGYGICFGGEEEYAFSTGLKKKASEIREKLNHVFDGTGTMYEDQYTALEHQASHAEEQWKVLREKAFERGKDPRNRAFEAGRAEG
ncbi:hypothetical protein AAFC00_000243 [Neodothiora populina]|uniref:Uncharacterized protein n=1 Tax=Neodothiora populina TaxID=2781224 RepID=A0ABR3P281_9PEZI